MKLFTLLALSAFCLPSFAQTCYVEMVNARGHSVGIYLGQGPESCKEGMKQCRFAIRTQPQLGGIDCIKDNGGRPAPAPGRNPRPQPGPMPRPLPPRHHDAIEVSSLILDVASAIFNAEKQTKVVEKLILELGSHSLSPFLRICSGTRTWAENASCLLSGVQRAPQELAYEEIAIAAVAKACPLTSTWGEEKGCFEKALSHGRLQSLSYYAQSCSQMWQQESAARCFREVFGVR